MGKKWPFLAPSHTAGEPRCLLTCSHFLLWEKLWVTKVSLGPELSWGTGGVNKMKLFLLASSVCPISDSFFFLQQFARTFPLELSDFHEATLVHGRLSKSLFFEGEDHRKLLFHPSAHITLLTSDLSLPPLVSECELCDIIKEHWNTWTQAPPLLPTGM